jgi:hypothetical protein
MLFLTLERKDEREKTVSVPDPQLIVPVPKKDKNYCISMTQN